MRYLLDTNACISYALVNRVTLVTHNTREFSTIAKAKAGRLGTGVDEWWQILTAVAVGSKNVEKLNLTPIGSEGSSIKKKKK